MEVWSNAHCILRASTYSLQLITSPERWLWSQLCDKILSVSKTTPVFFRPIQPRKRRNSGVNLRHFPCKLNAAIKVGRILLNVHFAFVHSHLLYGVEVYANTTTSRLCKLITLNNKLLRILQNKSIKHNSELYRTYFTLPLQLLHNFQILLFIYKYGHQ